jgi:transmembrane sensor
MTSPLSEQDPIGPVIVRVLADEATGADGAELARWLAGDGAREGQLEQLRAIWQEVGGAGSAWDTTALQQRIVHALETKVVPIRAEQRARRFGTDLAPWAARWWSWVPLAAAVVVAIAGVAVWRLAARGTAPAAVANRALTELATRRGQRAELRLSDGTRITLGVDSRLRYPEAFAAGKSRDVYLEGEAYFEVARDTLRPFRVHAGDATASVLGTRFGVRAFAEDRGVQVVVAEGRVALGRRSGSDSAASPAAEVVLARGDLGELEGGGMPAVRHGVEVSDYLAWVDGRLVFTDTPVGEVVRRLSRWYDLDIRVGDSVLAGDPYTVSLRGDEAPEHVLQAMAGALGVQLERRGAAYLLVRKRSDSSR